VTFSSTPTAFNRVVFAMLGRIIGQANTDLVLLNQCHQTLHELVPSTEVLWTIVQIDDQSLDVGKAVFDRLPPLDESICQTVAGHSRCDSKEKNFISGRHEDTHWRHGGNWLKIMISRFGCHAILTSPSKRTDLESSFGIHRDPSRLLISISSLIDLLHLGKDGVGFWNFLCG